jgi:predicted lipid-binding transport protein (Tim44 family)
MLREKVAHVQDPRERERIVKEAYRKEVEAHGESKLARMIQSGTWQGLAAGGGIGAGVGIGLGTVVGTVVGGIVSVPTTGLGALIGSGVGAIHGPWIRIPKGQDVTTEDTASSGRPSTYAEVKHLPEGQNENSTEQQDLCTKSDESEKPSSIRKRPRKLEVRTHAATGGERTPSEQGEQARRPRKLEMRSQVQPDAS